MDNINYSNENYLREMEKNAKLFEEKMNKLEKKIPNNINNKNEILTKNFKKQIRNDNNFSNKNKNNDNILEHPFVNNFQKNKINNYS